MPLQGQPFAPPSNMNPNLVHGIPLGSAPFQLSHPPSSQSIGCNCTAFSLEQNWPSVSALAPSWRGTMMWPEGLSEGEFRREECRRIVWSSIMAVANLNAYTVAVPDWLIAGFEKLLVREPEKVSACCSCERSNPTSLFSLFSCCVLPFQFWPLMRTRMRAVRPIASVRSAREDGQNRPDGRHLDSQLPHNAPHARLHAYAREQALEPCRARAAIGPGVDGDRRHRAAAPAPHVRTAQRVRVRGEGVPICVRIPSGVVVFDSVVGADLVLAV